MEAFHPNLAPSEGEQGPSSFTATHWSVVLDARDGKSPVADAALETLCRTYWAPLYAFIRRDGYGPEDAQDLTQEFLTRFVHRDWLHHLKDRRGKFRSFLLTFLKHFLSDERDRANAQKRGGGHALVSLQQLAEEERALAEPTDGITAEQVFERRWAQALLDQAIGRLRQEYVAGGKEPLFDRLKDLQPGEHGDFSYAELGAQLGMSEQAMKNAVHRFRRRHRELLREEIGATVGRPSEVEEEIQHLLAVVAR